MKLTLWHETLYTTLVLGGAEAPSDARCGQPYLLTSNQAVERSRNKHQEKRIAHARKGGFRAGHFL